MQIWWTNTIKPNDQSHWCRSTTKRLLVKGQSGKQSSSHSWRKKNGWDNTLGNLGIVRRTWRLGGKVWNWMQITWLRVWLQGFLQETFKGTSYRQSISISVLFLYFNNLVCPPWMHLSIEIQLLGLTYFHVLVAYILEQASYHKYYCIISYTTYNKHFNLDES